MYHKEKNGIFGHELYIAYDICYTESTALLDVFIIQLLLVLRGTEIRIIVLDITVKQYC